MTQVRERQAELQNPVWRRTKKALAYSLLILFALAFITPFVLSIATMFKTLPDINANPSSFIADPEYGWTLDGLRQLNTPSVRIPRWTFNSVVVSTFVVVGRVFLASLAGYALARLQFKGRLMVFALVVGVMAIPDIVLAIPRFLIMKQLGILNSYVGLIVPLIFDAFSIFMMKQFFEQLPREIEEAAAIDGASAFKTWRHVMLPLAAPALIALTILATQGSWNEFLHPLIAAPSDPDLRTLPVGLALMRGGFGDAQPWNALLGGSMITILPIAVIFFTFQRYFVQGVAASGTKG